MMDPYRILGITNRRVPHAELRAAYLKLAKQWHPDGHPTHKQAHATHQFKLISQAWDAIGTPSKRQKWDAQHYYGHSNTTYRTSTPRRNTTYDHYQQQQQQQQQQYYAEHDVHMKTYSTQEKIWFVVVLMVGSIGWWWWDRMKTAKAGVDVLVPAFFNRATGEWQRAPPEMFNSRDPFVISLIEYKPIHTLVGSDATTATAPITRVITSTTPTPVPGVRAYQLPFPTSGATKENHTTTTHTPTSTSNASSSATTPQTTNPTSTSESNKAAVASDPLSTTSSPQQVSVTSSNTDTSAPATATTSIQQLITSTPDSSSTPISTSASFANIHPLDVIPMNASHLQRQSITSNTHHHTNHPQPVSQPFIPHDMST